MSTVVHRVTSRGAEPSAGTRVPGRRIRRAALASFFVSVAVNAGLGIYAVLAPDFGDTQGRILGTSLSVSAALLLTLACEPAWERRLLGLVPHAGAALSAVGFALVIVGIWAEPAGDAWGKAAGSLLAGGVAGAVASLLALARVAPRHEWIFALALVLLGLGAALVGIAPWLGDDPSPWYLRAMGAVLIALGAFTVTVPVVHWVDRSALAALDAPPGAAGFCPYCGTELAAQPTEVLSCSRCGREFTVTEHVAT